MTINDELRGKFNAAIRWQRRRIKSGCCSKCGRRHNDKRYSRKEGKLVRRSTCLSCVERMMEAKKREAYYD